MDIDQWLNSCCKAIQDSNVTDIQALLAFFSSETPMILEYFIPHASILPKLHQYNDKFEIESSALDASYIQRFVNTI